MKIFQGIFCWHKQIIFEEHLCCKKKSISRDKTIFVSECASTPRGDICR